MGVSARGSGEYELARGKCGEEAFNASLGSLARATNHRCFDARQVNADAILGFATFAFTMGCVLYCSPFDLAVIKTASWLPKFLDSVT